MMSQRSARNYESENKSDESKSFQVGFNISISGTPDGRIEAVVNDQQNKFLAVSGSDSSSSTSHTDKRKHSNNSPTNKPDSMTSQNNIVTDIESTLDRFETHLQDFKKAPRYQPLASSTPRRTLSEENISNIKKRKSSSFKPQSSLFLKPLPANDYLKQSYLNEYFNFEPYRHYTSVDNLMRYSDVNHMYTRMAVSGSSRHDGYDWSNTYEEPQPQGILKKTENPKVLDTSPTDEARGINISQTGGLLYIINQPGKLDMGEKETKISELSSRLIESSQKLTEEMQLQQQNVLSSSEGESKHKSVQFDLSADSRQRDRGDGPVPARRCFISSSAPFNQDLTSISTVENDSIASNVGTSPSGGRLLEWDNSADVGYENVAAQKGNLSKLEQMVLTGIGRDGQSGGRNGDNKRLHVMDEKTEPQYSGDGNSRHDIRGRTNAEKCSHAVLEDRTTENRSVQTSPDEHKQRRKHYSSQAVQTADTQNMKETSKAAQTRTYMQKSASVEVKDKSTNVDTLGDDFQYVNRRSEDAGASESCEGVAFVRESPRTKRYRRKRRDSPVGDVSTRIKNKIDNVTDAVRKPSRSQVDGNGARKRHDEVVTRRQDCKVEGDRDGVSKRQSRRRHEAGKSDEMAIRNRGTGVKGDISDEIARRHVSSGVDEESSDQMKRYHGTRGKDSDEIARKHVSSGVEDGSSDQMKQYHGTRGREEIDRSGYEEVDERHVSNRVKARIHGEAKRSQHAKSDTHSSDSMARHMSSTDELSSTMRMRHETSSGSVDLEMSHKSDRIVIDQRFEIKNKARATRGNPPSTSAPSAPSLSSSSKQRPISASSSSNFTVLTQPVAPPRKAKFVDQIIQTVETRFKPKKPEESSNKINSGETSSNVRKANAAAKYPETRREAKYTPSRYTQACGSTSSLPRHLDLAMESEVVQPENTCSKSTQFFGGQINSLPNYHSSVTVRPSESSSRAPKILKTKTEGSNRKNSAANDAGLTNVFIVKEKEEITNKSGRESSKENMGGDKKLNGKDFNNKENILKDTKQTADRNGTQKKKEQEKKPQENEKKPKENQNKSEEGNSGEMGSDERDGRKTSDSDGDGSKKKSNESEESRKSEEEEESETTDSKHSGRGGGKLTSEVLRRHGLHADRNIIQEKFFRSQGYSSKTTSMERLTARVAFTQTTLPSMRKVREAAVQWSPRGQNDGGVDLSTDQGESAEEETRPRHQDTMDSMASSTQTARSWLPGPQAVRRADVAEGLSGSFEYLPGDVYELINEQQTEHPAGPTGAPEVVKAKTTDGSESTGGHRGRGSEATRGCQTEWSDPEKYLQDRRQVEDRIVCVREKLESFNQLKGMLEQSSKSSSSSESVEMMVSAEVHAPPPAATRRRRSRCQDVIGKSVGVQANDVSIRKARSERPEEPLIEVCRCDQTPCVCFDRRGYFKAWSTDMNTQFPSLRHPVLEKDTHHAETQVSDSLNRDAHHAETQVSDSLNRDAHHAETTQVSDLFNRDTGTTEKRIKIIDELEFAASIEVDLSATESKETADTASEPVSDSVSMDKETDQSDGTCRCKCHKAPPKKCRDCGKFTICKNCKCYKCYNRTRMCCCKKQGMASTSSDRECSSSGVDCSCKCHKKALEKCKKCARFVTCQKCECYQSYSANRMCVCREKSKKRCKKCSVPTKVCTCSKQECTCRGTVHTHVPQCDCHLNYHSQLLVQGLCKCHNRNVKYFKRCRCDEEELRKTRHLLTSPVTSLACPCCDYFYLRIRAKIYEKQYLKKSPNAKILETPPEVETPVVSVPKPAPVEPEKISKQKINSPTINGHPRHYFLKLEEVEDSMESTEADSKDVKKPLDVITIKIPVKKCGKARVYGTKYEYLAEPGEVEDGWQEVAAKYYQILNDGGHGGQRPPPNSSDRYDYNRREYLTRTEIEHQERKQRDQNKNMSYAPSLQEYLASNRPDFFSNAEYRRRTIAEMAKEREENQRDRLKGLVDVTPREQQRGPDLPRRIFTTAQMREQSRRQYRKLPEVTSKVFDRKKKAGYRTNRLMAEIYAKQLQLKALQGKVDLNNSVDLLAEVGSLTKPIR